MKEPIFKEEYQVGFYFFWKWQYQLRKKYLADIRNGKLNDKHNVDSYLKSIEKNKRYIKTSEEIINDYLGGVISLESLLTNVPRYFRQGHHAVEFKYKNQILSMSIDTSRVDLARHRKGIKEEIDGVFNMILEEKAGEGIVPDKIVSVGHEKYWRQAASDEVKNLKVDFLARATGLWLWDRTEKQKCSEQDIDDMFDIFPNLEADDTDSEHWYSKYRKRLALTHKCIQKAEVLPM